MMIFACAVTLAAVAQYQLPDPGFEDWSGATFANAIQPKYWNYSNVNQFGFDFNFSQRIAGRTGQYALRVEDQAMKVAGIDGGTSPGYVALGHPWAYVPSLTNIAGATAGTHGGIAFTARPDTVAVWIRRGGKNWMNENFNIVFYMWTGTAYGTSYSSNNGCTSIPSSFTGAASGGGFEDEESDIRTALDRNTCGLVTVGDEVGEAYRFERAEYLDWTCIKVPVFYFNSNVPDKCNLILSAGNYPAGKSTDGFFAGNFLEVDDVQLIYANTIQKLFIGGKEWKGFDPTSSAEQTYSLGRGVTTIPEIYAMRGAGTETNNNGLTATFNGRRLSNTECVVTPGAVDGAATVITVHAEDGSGSRTYRIKFVSQPSNNARLADITVNGETVPSFNPAKSTYNISLPFGTTVVPVVGYTKAEDGQVVTLTQATSTGGTATIRVTAPDGTTTMTYTLNFSVALLADNTLQDILVDGVSLPGFNPLQTSYTIELPLGTTEVPTITPVSAYASGLQTIAVSDNGLDGTYTISVSTQGNPTPKVYKLKFKVTASTYSYLADLKMGDYITSFNPMTTTYNVNLPLGTTELPEITYVPGDPYQTIEVVPGGLNGTTRVVVTAASGAQTTYKIVVTTATSSNCDLAMIYVNGQPIADFDAATLAYTIALPIGTVEAPSITYAAGDEYQTITMISGGLTGKTEITVMAGDGASVKSYTVRFTVAQATDNTLRAIYINGVLLDGFDPEVTEYSLLLAQGTTVLPEITYLAHDEYQTINVRSGGVNGDYRITVRPQSGSARTYTIHFSVAVSDNVSLSGISLNGQALVDFDPEVTEYSIDLPAGVAAIPTVTYTRGEASQKVLLLTSGSTVTIRVTSEAGSTRVYTITFNFQRSENANLTMIRLDGVDLPGFSPTVYEYTYTLSSSIAPAITVVKEETQQVTITSPQAAGVARIVVQPEVGAGNTYTIIFVSASSEVCALNAIRCEGEMIAGFSPSIYEYTLSYTTTRPALSWTPASESLTVTQIETGGQTQLMVASSEQIVTYTIHWVNTVSTESALSAIYLNGQPMVGFDPATLTYNIAAVAGQMPTVTYAKQSALSHVSAGATSESEYVISVTAEDGQSQRVYTLMTEIEHPVKQAQLSLVNPDSIPSYDVLEDILIYDEGSWAQLRGFEPTKGEYTYALPTTATSVPCIHPVLSSEDQQVTIAYGALNQPTVIQLTSKAGSRTYTILFTRAKSSNTLLKSLTINGESQSVMNTYFSYLLPYGTKHPYEFEYEQAEASQLLTVCYGTVRTPSYITVTAEDGNSRTYTIVYTVEELQGANVLNAITYSYIDKNNETHTGEITAPTATSTVELPYGTKHFVITGCSKNYSEQKVTTINGGVRAASTLIVSSERSDHSYATYHVIPKLATLDPTGRLSDIRFKGKTIPGFDPAVENYVLAVSSEPTRSDFDATSYDGKLISKSQLDTKNKKITLKASNGRTYTVSYYYAEDVPPFDFSSSSAWEKPLMADGLRPVGWKTVGDYIAKYTWTAPILTSTQMTHYFGKEVMPSGANSALLSTVRSMSSDGSVPGAITLGEWQNIYFNSGDFGAAQSTGFVNMDPTLGITYRNTPDSLAFDYKAIAFNNMERWKGWIRLIDHTGANTLLYFGDTYNTLNETEHLSLPLRDEIAALSGRMAKINMLLNSASTDSVQNLYGSGDNYKTADLIIQNLRFVYNSRLTGVKVDGAAATRYINPDTELPTDTFVITLSNDYVGVPVLAVTGEVADQQQQITWLNGGQWSEGKLVAHIVNYGENLLDHTDYYVICRRQAVTELGVDEQGEGREMTLSMLSPHQRYQVAVVRDTLMLTVMNEEGESYDHAYPLYEPLSNNAELASASYTDGVFVFDLGHIGQTVVTTETDTTLEVLVTAEDGVTTRQYEFPRVAMGREAGELALVDAAMDDLGRTTFRRVNREDLVTEVVTMYETQLVVARGEEHVDYSFISPYEKSNNATLGHLYIDGEEILIGGRTSFSFERDSIKTIEAIYGEQGQSLTGEITQVERVVDVTLHVTAANGTTTKDYTIHIEPTISNDATLAAIQIDGAELAEFTPARTTYTYVVPAPAVKTHDALVPDIAYVLQSNKATAVMEHVAAGFGDYTQIRVTAEDGTSRTYDINLEMEPCHNADLTMIYVDGTPLANFKPGRTFYSLRVPHASVDVKYATDDAYQTISVQDMSGDGLGKVITVTAEDGVTVREYEIEYYVAEQSNNANLASILLNGDEITTYDPTAEPFFEKTYTYRISLAATAILPDISARMQEDAQTLVMTRQGDTIILAVTAEDGVTTNDYRLIFTREKSQDATLSMIYVGGKELPGFDPGQMAYLVQLEVGVKSIPAVDVTLSHPLATETHSYDDALKQYTYFIVAEDGLHTQPYTVQFEFTYSNADTLLAAYEDGIAIPDFRPHTFTYHHLLDVGVKTVPELTFDEGDEYQTITTEVLTTGLLTIFRVSVVAESGRQNVYTFAYEQQLSAVDTLRYITIGGVPLEGFDADVTEYNYTLPYGTTVLPRIAWSEGDEYQTVALDEGGVNGSTRIVVTAENGNQRVYIIRFSTLPSTNAQLQMITYSGIEVPNFDPDVAYYSIDLPVFSTAIPVIGFTRQEQSQQVDVTMDAENVYVVVTAEDGVTTFTYTLTFRVLRSMNAKLQNILLDGNSIKGFSPDIYEYSIELPYGTEQLPEITWATSDSEQQVELELTSETVRKIIVTAGDGETESEYTITFTYQLSPNCEVTDILVRGESLEGFDPRRENYYFAYPAGSTEDVFFTPEDIEVKVTDPTTNVDKQMNGNTIVITVTSQDESKVLSYIIEQEILLYDNSRLSAIYIDGELVEGFDAEVLSYSFLLPQGAILPEITATAEDSRATVDVTPGAVGEPTIIFCTAEDGSATRYEVLIEYTTVSAGVALDKNACRAFPVAGTTTMKVVTLRNNTICQLYDLQGHLLWTATNERGEEYVPVVNPNYVTVGVDAYGSEFIQSITAEANGAVTPELQRGKTYILVFSTSRSGSQQRVRTETPICFY